MKQVLRCGHLFDTDTKRFVEGVDLYIDGNKIEALSTGAPLKEGYEVIDLSDKYVLPGLIDCHVHVNMNGEPATDYMSKQTIGDSTITAICNAQSDLMAGFTTIRDEGSVFFTDIAVRDAINAGKIDGPRMFCSGIPIGTTGGHADSHFNPYITGETSMGFIIDSPDEGRKAARKDFKYGADQIKLMATGGVLSFGDDPGAPELTFEEMKAVIDEAKTKGRITSAHTHGAEGIKMAVRAGITSIEHGTMADQEAHDLMLENGTWLVPTLQAPWHIMKNGTQMGIPAPLVEKCAGVMETHFATFARAYKMGIKIAFGTDTGTPFATHGSQALEFELMVKQGMDPGDAILSATKWAAQLIRWEDRVGTLKEGLFADVVAVDSDPLADITALKEVTFIMKDGKVYKN
ncbi:metal-dependent hydrolase family protein [Bittarella massiliensis (ex Durand et al. 2017)]|uniref:metal-dependent hydrolase family protein n=1 Tax=Bittarella massiliensis (ex Durand et al. 2017) TaxID=1720313 RepID=UPI001AA1AA75|nr:amidohydrolase family protein [Bittarella massiliensis (ex Durand et al. 2017)]MBO1679565.1 amidohydrolase family protein [Bittarella massiliensis (ex Durand et al. 2017)]